jgi:tRNA1(Val) A37 N6-methylase TrmN6
MAVATTDDAVLGGRLRLRQPKRGHRVGHDAILLAAATGGRAGEHAVEFGAGIGAAGLALAQRVSGLQVSMVEIDPFLCALAAGNAARNGLAARTVCADVVRLPLRPGIADRVLMNPPFNQAHRHNASPDPLRRRAHVAGMGLLPAWIDAAAEVLREGGVLTLIWRADDLDAVLAALAGPFGKALVLPVLPRENALPIRVLVSAVKGAAWSRSDLAPFVLNDASGRPAQAAEAVMRHAATLPLAGGN